MAYSFVKDDDAVLDYQINWSDMLDSDTISASSWTADSGITIDSDSNTTTAATVWLSGGTAGTSYTVTNRIVTDGGLTDERSIEIDITPGGLYCTLEDVKGELGITSAADDALILSYIKAANSAIDDKTGYTFSAATDTTRYFDANSIDSGGCVDGRKLILGPGNPLAAITSITNGDGTTVTSGQYVTEPRRIATYCYEIHIRSDAAITWTYTTYWENAIAIVGRWAYSITPPANIQQACRRLSAWMYRLRENRTGDQDRAIVTAGATLLPAQIPSDIAALLRPYTRLT